MKQSNFKKYIDSLEKLSHSHKIPSVKELSKLEEEFPISGEELLKVDSLAEGHIQRSELLSKKGEFEGGIVELERAATLQPRKSEIRLKLADLALNSYIHSGFKKSERERVQNYLKQAIEINASSIKTKELSKKLKEYANIEDENAHRRQKRLLLLVLITFLLLMSLSLNIERVINFITQSGLQEAPIESIEEHTPLSGLEKEIPVVFNANVEATAHWQESKMNQSARGVNYSLVGEVVFKEDPVNLLTLELVLNSKTNERLFIDTIPVVKRGDPLHLPGDSIVVNSNTLFLYLPQEIETAYLQIEELSREPASATVEGEPIELYWKMKPIKNLSCQVREREHRIAEGIGSDYHFYTYELLNNGEIPFTGMDMTLRLYAGDGSYIEETVSPVGKYDPSFNVGTKRVVRFSIETLKKEKGFNSPILTVKEYSVAKIQ